MQDDRFEWDDAKAESNRRRHGVTFDAARSAIDDPGGFEEPDEDPDEERWKGIVEIVRENQCVWVCGYNPDSPD